MSDRRSNDDDSIARLTTSLPRHFMYVQAVVRMHGRVLSDGALRYATNSSRASEFFT